MADSNRVCVMDRCVSGETVQRETLRSWGAAAPSKHRSAEDPRDSRASGGTAKILVDQAQWTRGQEQLGQAETDGEWREKIALKNMLT